jgi:hypothetical protein
LVEIQARLVELVPNHLSLIDRKLKFSNQPLNKITISPFGWYAPCRSMLLNHKSRLSQSCQFISDGRRTNIQLITLDKGFRANRRPSLYEIPYD